MNLNKNNYFNKNWSSTFSKGAPPLRNQLITAWPDSWYAVTFVSSFPLAFFSYPARTLSLAFSKSIELTSEAPALAARMAASLHKLAMSAPEKPGDNVAKRFAYCSFDIKLESFNGLKCTLKIYARLGKSGKDTSI